MDKICLNTLLRLLILDKHMGHHAGQHSIVRSNYQELVYTGNTSDMRMQSPAFDPGELCYFYMCLEKHLGNMTEETENSLLR